MTIVYTSIFETYFKCQKAVQVTKNILIRRKMSVSHVNLNDSNK